MKEKWERYTGGFGEPTGKGEMYSNATSKIE